ncbi:MAG: HIT family protein [Actinomycetota bacterium]
MERLWSPWRSEYVGSAGEGDECIFCSGLERGADEDSGILYRAARSFVLLNAFPYNSGHVMVAPTRHVGELHDMTEEERGELMDVTTTTIEVIRRGMNPHGFNVGMNLGRVAGAGIPGHLHMHVVPRWGGDTNFMPVVGETKVLPEMLSDTDAKLRPLFAELADPGR